MAGNREREAVAAYDGESASEHPAAPAAPWSAWSAWSAQALDDPWRAA